MEIPLFALTVLVIGCIYTIILILGVRDLIRYFKEIKYYEYTNYEPEMPSTGMVWLITTIALLYGALSIYGQI